MEEYSTGLAFVDRSSITEHLESLTPLFSEGLRPLTGRAKPKYVDKAELDKITKTLRDNRWTHKKKG